MRRREIGVKGEGKDQLVDRCRVIITCVIDRFAAPSDFAGAACLHGAVVVLKTFDKVHSSWSDFPVLMAMKIIK